MNTKALKEMDLVLEKKYFKRHCFTGHLNNLNGEDVARSRTIVEFDAHLGIQKIPW